MNNGLYKFLQHFKENGVFYLYVFLLAVYLISRKLFVIVPVSLFIGYLLLKKTPLYIKCIGFLRKYRWWFLGVSLFLYLIFCWFYFRIFSYDGLLWYLKNFIALTKNLNPGIVEFPIPPFIVELVLAILYRNLGLNFVNLIFGVASVFAAISFYWVLTYMTESKFVRIAAFLSVLSSPMFSGLAVWEMKTDLFLLLFSCLSYVFYIKFLKTYVTRYALFFGFFCAASFLTKITSLPISIMLFLFLVVEWFVYQRNNKFLASIFLSFAAFSLPILIWVSVYGINLVWYPFSIFGVQQPKISLERDSDLMKACLTDLRHIDFNQFFLDKQTFLDKASQPIKYFLTQQTSPYLLVLDPGVLLYISIWVFIFVVLRYYKVWLGEDRYKTYLVISIGVFLLYFFLQIRSIYWYLIPAIPLLSLALPWLIENKISHNIYKYAGKGIFMCVVGMYLLFYVSRAIDVFYNFFPSSIISIKFQRKIYFPINKALSNFLNTLDPNYYIMDLSPTPPHLFLTFVDNGSERVFLHNHYFVVAKKSLEEMREELLRNHVRYLVVNYIEREETVLFGCPRKNQDIAAEFVKKHTKEIYSFENVAKVYEIF